MHDKNTSYQEGSDMSRAFAAVVLSGHVVDLEESFRMFHTRKFKDVRDKFAEAARNMLLAESATLLYKVGELAPEVLLVADRLSDDGITEETYKYAHEIVSTYVDERNSWDDTKNAMHFFCKFLRCLLDPQEKDILYHRHITDAILMAAKISLHRAGYNAAQTASDEACDGIDEYFEAIEKMRTAQDEAIRKATFLVDKLYKLWVTFE
jgi:hypothetical protein